MRGSNLGSHRLIVQPRLGKISKMGQRDLRRLLIVVVMAEIELASWVGMTPTPWASGAGTAVG